MSRIWEQVDGPVGSEEARHEAILRGMKDALRQRVRRRRVARMLAAGAAGVALVVGLSLMVRMQGTGPGAGSRETTAAVHGSEAPVGGPLMLHAEFQVVQTRPASELGRGPASISVLDDDQLLTELQTLGRPSGLIRTGGKVVVTGDVDIKAGDEAPGRI